MKRVFDLIFAWLLIILFMPIFIIISLLVLFDVGYPIIYKHRCPGLDEKVFTLYRFKTMNDELGTNGHLLRSSQRLTKLGKILKRYGLDDLPQLFNVVKGDMSIVGPRPVLIRTIPKRDAINLKRHSVRPGITGWTQVHDHRLLSWEQKFNLDMYYIEHQNLWFDLKIVWLTVKKIIERIRNKYSR